MICDKETNKVFLSKGLMHYGRVLERILAKLSGWNIETQFLPLADSKKHIWARDYMPIQLEKDKFLLYRYTPDYLKGFEDFIPDNPSICKSLQLNCVTTDIVLDGGNVVKCGDKVIMTDKIIQENPTKFYRNMIAELENHFQAQIVLVPWDRYEKYGHADGMVRWIDGNRVLLNNYADFDPGLRKELKKTLSEHFTVEELAYGSNKHAKVSWAYINFLQTSKCIFVPGLGIEEDGILSALTEKTYLMHDHVKYNYRKEFLFRNIECIQHMERELEKVFRASNHPWAQEMKTLIQEMLHKRKKYLKEKIESFTSEETNQFEERLENLLIKAHREYESETNRYFSADEMNAIRKLEEYRQNYFAWVYDFTLPTTNNISESGLRMTKTKQKVSGQFLKEETAAEFAAVRTYTETCRKNGVNEYEALKRLMQENPYTVKEILTGMT